MYPGDEIEDGEKMRRLKQEALAARAYVIDRETDSREGISVGAVSPHNDHLVMGAHHRTDETNPLFGKLIQEYSGSDALESYAHHMRSKSYISAREIDPQIPNGERQEASVSRFDVSAFAATEIVFDLAAFFKEHSTPPSTPAPSAEAFKPKSLAYQDFATPLLDETLTSAIAGLASAISGTQNDLKASKLDIRAAAPAGSAPTLYAGAKADGFDLIRNARFAEDARRLTAA